MWQIWQLAFANPIVLSALAVLPAIWWLLRVTPPAPRRLTFPALRLLLGLDPSEQSAAHLPWWLMALRLLLGSIVILAFAEPRLHPQHLAAATRPLIAVVDDTAYAAPDWNERLRWLDEKLAGAESTGRAVMLVTTAETLDRQPPELQSAAAARARARALSPKAWRADRAAAATRLAAAKPPQPAEIIWLCDGIEDSGRAALESALDAMGSVTIAGDWQRGARALALAPGPEGRIGLKLMRSQSGEADTAQLRIVGDSGLILERRDVPLGAGDNTTDVDLNLPSELANRIQRIEIEGSASAASVVLWDDRFRRRAVGLVSGGSFETEQSLLSDVFYLERALKPYSDISSGTLAAILERNPSAIVLADVGRVPGDEEARLTRFVEAGGLLLRFAGPKLAAAAEAKTNDLLLPVALRAGDRALGGALTWEHALGLAPFEADSPFAGLPIPGDVVVNRQILAEPGGDPNAKTWARLEDGTPLVSALHRGQGWLVLVHVTATPDWSNLALSGLYVDMLRRLLAMSRASASTAAAIDPSGSLKPVAALDGFGAMGAPPASAEPIDAGAVETMRAGPRHPPGLYGEDAKRRALNLIQARESLVAMPVPAGAAPVSLELTPERDLMPALLLAALLLALIDQIATLVLSGRLRLSLRRAGIVAGALAMALTFAPRTVRAAPITPGAAAGDSRLAYVLTGDSAVDTMSKAGMRGLSDVLARRTAFEPADPAAIDIERDDIVFYPVLYWPMSETEPPLSNAAAAKVDAYMKAGGLIVFDTRDQSAVDPRGGPGRAALRLVLSKLDIPPLARVASDHVLTKTFYLLQSFPGRWADGEVWVEASKSAAKPDGRAAANDGVSPLIIGSNDWAAAWAVDEHGNPMAVLIPDDAEQRELAYRFGINLVMYALTGNYKTDQVHVPTLLERLGQ